MKYYILIALGVLVFGVGAALAVINHVDSSWPRVSGKVIGTRVVNDNASPVVEYDTNGTKFQVIASDQPVIGSFRSGKSLVVAYNPNSPGEVKIPASGTLSAVTGLLISVGSVLTVTGGIIRKRRQDKYADEQGSADPVEDAAHQV